MYVVFECEARESESFSHFDIFMFQLRQKNITHIAYPCHKEITRKATFECKRNYDENSTRASRSKTGTRGNPLMVVCQKWLTGHPKGAAAAWMLNGMLQTLNSGIVPGNRNADDIDSKFEAYHHLFYPCKSIRVGPGRIKAVMLKSFGFGQAGAEILLIHPHLLFEAAGMRMKNNKCFSVQYHPEAGPGPNDATYLFDIFKEYLSN